VSSFTPTADGGPIVVVGSINVDQLMVVERHPAPGETLIAVSMEFLPGGKGANQAVAAARLGAHVSLVGATGRDSVSGLATALLERAGVDLSAVRAVDGPTGLALVTVADDGENTIVVVPGANAAVGADVVGDAADLIARAAVVVLQGEIPADGIEEAVRLATGRVVLNLAPVIAVDPEAIRRADPLVVNEHEAALVLALFDPSADIPREDAELVARLRQWGVTSVVLTRGEQGAICSDSLGTMTVPSPRVDAVDSSGAGDAFVGALSGRLAAGSTLLDAVRLAGRVGAFAVRTLGTQQSDPGADDELPEVEK
jgi:ribokinase